MRCLNHFLLLAGLLLVIGGKLHAQKNIATQTHGWYMFFGNHRISEHWGLHTEYQWRRHQLTSQWQQSLLRVGIDYYPDKNNSLTAGYGWIVSFPYGEQPVPETFTEHRIWEQWSSHQRAGRLYINHRYRLEQRFLERPAESRYVFRQRVRYRILLTFPLSNPELSDHTLFAAAYAEPFLGFGKGIGKNILDQNRLYLALGYRFNPQCNVQVGYLNQYVVKPDGVQQERNHTLQAGITFNLDFRKE